MRGHSEDGHGEGSASADEGHGHSPECVSAQPARPSSPAGAETGAGSSASLLRDDVSATLSPLKMCLHPKSHRPWPTWPRGAAAGENCFASASCCRPRLARSPGPRLAGVTPESLAQGH